MAYSDRVDICFSLSAITKFLSDAEYLSDNASGLCAEVDALVVGAINYVSDTLAYIKSCLDINYTDGQNAAGFRRWLEDAIWKTEKALESHEQRCNDLEKQLKAAENDHARIQWHSKPGDKASLEALEEASRAVRNAKDALSNAYAERDSCKRKLGCLKEARNSLYWIEDNIHKDYIMLTDRENEYNRLLCDLDSVYKTFNKQSEIGQSQINESLDYSKVALRYARGAVQHIGQMIGVEPSDDNETRITSIAAIYSAGDRMDSLNRMARSSNKYLGRTSAEYNELVLDNVVGNAAERIEDLLEYISAEIKANENKAENAKDLAHQLQQYYDSV
ncbi:MAG: hypothetical protein IKC87_06745 [Clostridia bacterium]|nr:hypothetical protein [Clostridia bacterium]